MKIEQKLELTWSRHLICPVCGNTYEFENPSATISFELPSLDAKSMSTIIGLNSDGSDLVPDTFAIDRVLVGGCGFYCSHHPHPVKMILLEEENTHLKFLFKLFMSLGFTIKEIKNAYLDGDHTQGVYHIYYFKNLTNEQMDYLKFLYSTSDNPKDYTNPNNCLTHIEMFIKKDRGVAVFAARWSLIGDFIDGFERSGEASDEINAINEWYEKHPDDRESTNNKDFVTDRIFDFVSL